MLQPFSSSPSPNVRWLLSATSLLFLCNLLLGPSLAQLLFQLDGPQPCPDNPIRLPALRTVQYIYSPYDEQRNYPADTDCQFLIEASDPQHRIHLSVMDSELEEPLFTECNDFVSVREGNETSPKEVARWCGQDFPASISSASDSLLVHFHSDSVVQKRGFNISFVQFELPGCPPDWKSDTASPFCYKLFVLPHILTWFEAQKECNFERANLATFRDEADYAFVFAQHSDIHSFPWIGYTDAYAEGVFEAIDRNVPLWPENFPLKQENEMRDCVYLDWNKKDRIHYEIDDCRNRKPFLCKKRKDGTEVPVLLPAGLIRRGFHDSSLDYSLLVGVIVLLLLVLVVACLLYNKFRERSNNNRVVNVDLNQRLVQQQQGGAAADSRSTLQIGTGKSVSDQKAAAAAGLAKEKERREKKYEQKSGKNMAAGPSRRSPPKPLESQESTTSFPLHTFQSVFAKQTQMEMETRQMAQQTGRAAESPAHSPRISLSPNQPDLDESQRQGRRDQQEVEEEEEDQHNMGYEPDSEEESERRREREEGEEEQQIRERDEAERNWREEDKEEGEGEKKRQQQRAEQQLQEEEEAVNKGEGETSANVAASSATGIIGSLGPRTTTTEHPVRPPIELLMDSEKKSRKERRAEEEQQQPPVPAPPLREGTLFSTGQQTADSGQSRMRHRRKSFERPPPVGPLDSVSAISLDEFWQQQQQQQPQLQQQQPQQPLPPPQQK